MCLVDLEITRSQGLLVVDVLGLQGGRSLARSLWDLWHLWDVGSALLLLLHSEQTLGNVDVMHHGFP